VRHSENARAGRVEFGAAAQPARLSIEKRLDILEHVAKDARDKHRATTLAWVRAKPMVGSVIVDAGIFISVVFITLATREVHLKCVNRYSDVNLHS
jgi:hypothetical protein